MQAAGGGAFEANKTPNEFRICVQMSGPIITVDKHGYIPQRLLVWDAWKWCMKRPSGVTVWYRTGILLPWSSVGLGDVSVVEFGNFGRLQRSTH